MTFTLRSDQAAFDQGVQRAWAAGCQNVVGVAPTGFGKTVTTAKLIEEKYKAQWYCLVIVHRKELVEQMSLALARCSVPHTFIAAQATVNTATSRQRDELGYSMYDPQSRVFVSSIDTLKNRNTGKLTDMLNLWICDEAHHCLQANKWGLVQGYSNAYGLGITATPERADKKGIGRHASGVFDYMVLGPTLRECIEAGNLCEYDLTIPPNDLHREDVPVGPSGEFVQTKLTVALEKSHIYGDVVQHYLERARGKIGVTFAQTVDKCGELAAQFIAAGVPALALSAKNTNKERYQALKALRSRQLWQIVNCDLFGEGFDAPVIEIMQDAQPTQSYGKFAQKFGRALRVDPARPDKRAEIFDHVGNIKAHGVPDNRCEWSLEDRKRVNGGHDDEEATTLTICGSCFHAFEKGPLTCPYCGEPLRIVPVSAGLADIEGSLVKLTREQLEELRGMKTRIDRTPIEVRDAMLLGGFSDAATYGQMAQQRKRLEQQAELRNTTALWAGLMRTKGMAAIEHELFVRKFGVNVLRAQSLNRAEAEKLTDRIREDIEVML